MALLAPGTKHPGAQVAAITAALAALTAAVADLRQSQHRLHQAEAARTSAEHLRQVAPLPHQASATATTARRPKNAADLAAMSFSSSRSECARPSDTQHAEPGRGSGRGTAPTPRPPVRTTAAARRAIRRRLQQRSESGPLVVVAVVVHRPGFFAGRVYGENGFRFSLADRPTMIMGVAGSACGTRSVRPVRRQTRPKLLAFLTECAGRFARSSFLLIVAR
jgi:hypothetical protein